MNLLEAKAWLATKDSGLEYFKYVRLVGGEYRFSPMGGLDHRELAQGAHVETAAEIRVYPDCCKIEGYSSTLQKSYDQEDLAALPQLFGVPLNRD